MVPRGNGAKTCIALVGAAVLSACVCLVPAETIIAYKGKIVGADGAPIGPCAVKLREAVTDKMVFEDAGIVGEFNVHQVYGACALPDQYFIEVQCDRHTDMYRSQTFSEYGNKDDPLDLGIITLHN